MASVGNIIHNLKHIVMVCGVQGWGKVNNLCGRVWHLLVPLLRSAGSMRRSSLTIPSSPRNILLLRVLIHSMKALLSSIEEWSQILLSVPSDSTQVRFDCSWKGSEGAFTGSFSACSQGYFEGASFRKVSALSNTYNLLRIFEVNLQIPVLAWLTQFSWAGLGIFYSLEVCPWLCIRFFKYFCMCSYWCLIDQSLLHLSG